MNDDGQIYGTLTKIRFTVDNAPDTKLSHTRTLKNSMKNTALELIEFFTNAEITIQDRNDKIRKAEDELKAKAVERVYEELRRYIPAELLESLDIVGSYEGYPDYFDTHQLAFVFKKKDCDSWPHFAKKKVKVKFFVKFGRTSERVTDRVYCSFKLKFFEFERYRNLKVDVDRAEFILLLSKLFKTSKFLRSIG